MERTRVLLVEMPRMLRQLFEEAIATDGRMDVVGELESCEHLPATVRRTQPHFVIWGNDGRREPLFAELLYEHPRMGVLAVEQAGGHSALWELRPQRTSLGEATPDTIVAAIRARRSSSDGGAAGMPARS